jgi:hypothetical protein
MMMVPQAREPQVREASFADEISDGISLCASPLYRLKPAEAY